jgi:hypothetical protein
MPCLSLDSAVEPIRLHAEEQGSKIPNAQMIFARFATALIGASRIAPGYLDSRITVFTRRSGPHSWRGRRPGCGDHAAG